MEEMKQFNLPASPAICELPGISLSIAYSHDFSFASSCQVAAPNAANEVHCEKACQYVGTLL